MTDHLLPPSATHTLRELSIAANRATSLPVAIRDEWSPERCPAHMLPWLAWAVGVEEWDVRWTDAQKRSAIASSLAVKRTKGTIGAVVTAVASLGLGAKVVEWFNQVPAGDPYTFDLAITAGQAGFDQAQWELLLALISRTKNVRSHLDELQLNVDSTTTTYGGAVAMLGLDITIDYGGQVDFPDPTLLHIDADNEGQFGMIPRAIEQHDAGLDSDNPFGIDYNGSVWLGGEGWFTSELSRPIDAGDFTIEFWAKPYPTSDASAVYLNIGGIGADGSLTISRRASTEPHLLEVRLGTLPPIDFADSAPFPIEAWTHLALVRHVDRFRLYIGGQEVANVSAAPVAALPHVSVLVGGDGTNARSFAGRMDEIRVSAVARYTANFDPLARLG